MSLAQLRRSSQITLPLHVKQFLHVNEGDYLEFAIEQGKVIVAPVSVQRKDAAWHNLFSNLDHVYAENKSTIDQNDVNFEDEILNEIKAIRQSKK